MPVGFNSPARNLFLLGSSGAQVVTNFFKTIDQSAGTDQLYLPDEIKYNDVDQKFVLAGSASDSQVKGFGWLEKRQEDGTQDWGVRVEATQTGVNTTLLAMELDVNDKLIVGGKTGDVPWIAKYSNGGVIEWQSTTNTANLEYTGITSDSNGQYYACGSQYPGSGAVAFVEKFDANGNPGWGKAGFMLGREVLLYAIAANSRGEVVAVGQIEDDNSYKGYIVKIDTNTGEVLWDRTLTQHLTAYGYVVCRDVYIDSKDQIYIVGARSGGNPSEPTEGFLIKYSPEGNIIWQKASYTPNGTLTNYAVKSDGETEQTIVFGTYYDQINNDLGGVLSKYSKNGDLVWRRTIYSSYNNADVFGSLALDADPSFYYLLYVDDNYNALNGTPLGYTFGKVSSSGNGLGGFEYTEGTGETIDYEILNVQDKIGRLSDGSVRQDTSDLITYPFNGTKILFDDLATQVTNKKRQMDTADSFEYSGSPAIRPADFQELNLLGGVGITSETVSTSVSSVDISGTTMNNPLWTSTSGLTGTLQISLSGGTTDALTSFVNNAVSGDSVSGSDLWNYGFVTVTLTSSFTEVSTDVWEASSTSSSNPGSDFGLNYYEISTDTVPAAPYPLTLYFPYTASVTTTTWGDQSGKGNSGTVNGATSNAAGWWEFDGTNDEIDFGNQASIITSGSFTIEAWAWRDTITAESGLFNIEDSNQGVILLSAGNNGGNDYRFLVRKGTYGAGPVQANVEAAIAGHGLNEWHHYLGTYDDDTGTIIMYVDGVQVDTDTNASIIGVNFSGTLDSGIHIGPSAGRGRWHDGRIGEVRIYPRALTSAQVFQNYNATKFKYTNEAPDIAPKISDSAIVYDSNLLLNYDFGNRATYDLVENLYGYSNNFDTDEFPNSWSGIAGNNPQYMGKIGPNGEDVWQFDLIQRSGVSEGEASFQQRILPAYPAGTITSQRWLMRSAPGYGTQTVYHKHGRNAIYAANQANVEFDITEEWSEITTTESVYTGNTKEFFGIGTVNAGVVVQIAKAQLWIGFENARYVDTYGVRLTAPTTVKNLSSNLATGIIDTDVTFNSGGWFEFPNTNANDTIYSTSSFLTTSPGLGSSTIELWIKDSTNPANHKGPFWVSDNFGNWIMLDIRSDYNSFQISTEVKANNRQASTNQSQLVDTNWHHIVITRSTASGGGVNAWIDNSGVSFVPNDGYGSWPASTNVLVVGGFSNGGINSYQAYTSWEGKIGEFRIYNRVLTPTEITQNYNATRGKYGV